MHRKDHNNETFAKGGGKLGRTRDFLKGPDQFRTDKGVEQDYSKGKASAGGGKDKCLPPVKPRS